MLTLRPFNAIKQWKKLADARARIIEQLKTMTDQQAAVIERQAKIIETREQHIAILQQRVTAFQKPAPPMYEEMGLPTVEAVESLVSAFFHDAPISLCRQAVEGCGNADLQPGEVRATQITLKKLWKIYAMKRLSQGVS